MLETKNLCRTYMPKNGVPVKALDNVSLTLAETGMVFILGKSGSGKSTFLNVLGGLDKYDGGELIVYGKSSKNFSQSEFDSYRNTYIGFVFQEYNIMQEFSVGQNIALALQLQGKKATREAVAEIMEQVDLKGYEDRKTNELSGGQKQRVAIARALIKDPKIIMADEPTGALDSKTGVQVFDTLKKLSKDKLVLVVSHDRDFAERYADRIIEFSDGKVISDTTKTEIAATSESEKISVVDGKILQIKSGTTLTEKDLDVINSYIKENENDTFISLDGNLNKELRKVSKINESGAKETFKQTDKEDVAIKTYGENDFKTIKSRLPVKNSLKIAASSLKAKPIRLFFTIILSAIAFTLFGLMSVFSTYDKNVAYIETFSDLGTKTVFVQRTKKHFYGKGEDDYYMANRGMSSSEITKLNEDFSEKNLTFVAVTGQTYYLSFESSLGKELIKFGDYYRTRFSGLATITEKEIENFGYTLSGTLPVKHDEIAVTDYFFDVYKTSAAPDAASVTVLSSLIGKTVTINFSGIEEPCIITAVIDTNFDSENTYEPLKTRDGTDDMSLDDALNLNLQFISELDYGLSNLCFVSESFMTDYEFDNTVYDFFNGSSDYRLTNSANTYGDISSGMVYPFSSINTFETDRDCVFYYPNGKDNLGGNSVVVPFYYLVYDETAFEEEYKSQTEKLEVPSSYSDLDEYCIYLASDGWETEGKSIMREILLKTAAAYWNTMSAEDKTLTMDRVYWDGYDFAYENVPITVDGIYVGNLSEKPSYSIADFYSCLGGKSLTFFGENIASTLGCPLSGAFSGAVGKLPESKAEIREFVNYFAEVNDDNGWSFVSYVSETLEMLDMIITILLDVFLYAGVALAIFAAFLMMNFIATSIVYKKREIGILRAVGARGLDVFGIFFNEAMIIALINFAVSVVFLLICVTGINSAFQAGLPVALTLFAISAVPLVLILGVSILTAFVASFIPSFKISLKRPIDAIQNR